MKKRFVLTPCGTSLLTNNSPDRKLRNLVYRYANEKTKENIEQVDRQDLESLIRTTSGLLSTANNTEAAKMSAELNGIIRIYEGTLESKGDTHLLLSTDTWLGEETANMVQNWLERHGLNATVYRHTDLQTADLTAFMVSISDLIKELEERLPKKGYNVIFNLTGGFKGVQGFLQSIAHFYADESVYIFEGASELLRIPKLPARLVPHSVIKENFTLFRKLDLEIQPLDSMPEGIPKTLLYEIESSVSLSAWGRIQYNQVMEEIYSEKLVDSPIDKIRYSKQFTKSVKNLPPDRMLLVNKRIDQLVEYINEHKNPSSLDFKKLRGNPFPTSTHEFDAWSDKDAKRVFCHYENSVIVLDELRNKLN